MNGENIGYYKKPVSNTTQNSIRNIESIIQEIKTSQELKTVCSKIRDIKDPDQKKQKKLRNAIKEKELPYITPHGICQPSRKDENFKEHSGIIVFDVDDMDEVTTIKAKLIEDPYLVFAFISPGGNGLKFGSSTDAVDKQSHDTAWAVQAQYFKDTYSIKIDPEPKAVSNACFLSSDPDAYFNPKAKVFTGGNGKAEKTPSETPGDTTIPPEIVDRNPRDKGNRWEFDCLKCGRKAWFSKGGTTMHCSHLNSCGWIQRIASAEHFHQSDDGNAQRFILLQGPKLLFCHGKRKRWFVWDGLRYQEDRTGTVHYLARDVAAHIKQEAIALPHDTPEAQKKQKELFGFGISSENNFRLKALVERTAYYPEIAVTPEMLDRDPMRICVRNGYLNLKTGKLEAPDPERLVTRQAAVKFDPTATCPKWMNLIDKATCGNHTLANFIQQVGGYLLTGETYEDKFFLFIGGGANGKSTILETLGAILGDYAVTPPPGTFLERKFNNPSAASPELALLPGARLATMSETDKGDKVALGLIKRLAAGGKGSARDMYAGLESDTPTVKIIIDSNHPPRITSNDFGTWRRVVRIPFDYKFEGVELIPDFRVKMVRDEYGEHSGILNWMVDGCLKWQQAGRLVLPEEVETATETYRKEEDPVTRFLDECTTVGDGFAAQAGLLFSTFRKWAETNGERCELSNVKFADEIKSRGFRKIKTNRGSSYKGFAINEVENGF